MALPTSMGKKTPRKVLNQGQADSEVCDLSHLKHGHFYSLKAKRMIRSFFLKVVQALDQGVEPATSGFISMTNLHIVYIFVYVTNKIYIFT